MNCPKCHSTEFDSGGYCLVCGLRALDSGDGRDASGGAQDPIIPTGSDSVAPAAAAELPEWRQELSRRLQEIKLRREATEPAPEGTPPVEAASAPVAEEPPPASETEIAQARSPRRQRRTARVSVSDRREESPEEAAGERDVPAPVESPEPRLAVVRTQAQESSYPSPVTADHLIRRSEPTAEVRLQTETRDLIDAAVARQISMPPPEPPISEAARPPATDIPPVVLPTQPPRPEPKVAPKSRPVPVPDPAPAPNQPWISGPLVKSVARPSVDIRAKAKITPEPERVPPPFATPEVREDRLILLTRTLSGLVDLILVILCAGLMVLAVDIIEGIDVLDTVSLVHYGLLFLLMYFVYSIFFLAIAGQTVGMMITDVRMIGESSEHVPVSQILLRCFVFVIGTAAAGIGLLWGCFDREARCLHDRVSGTRVHRVLQDS
jgi:uncharacterized RDD family membrane protein YckC